MIVGCARESTSKAVQDEAFAYQIERLRKYGCDRIYEDRESGRKLDRKTHDEILKGIKSGEITEVVATSMSRLGRSIPAIYKIITACSQYNCKLTLLDSDVNLNTPMGKGFLMQQAVFAEMESDMISERAKLGHENRRRLSKASLAVWGYQIVSGKYEPDHTEIRPGVTPWLVAQDMVNEFKKLKTLRGVLKYLSITYPYLFEKVNNKKLYRIPQTAQGIRHWLLSEVLLGNLYFDKEDLLVTNTHEPLITTADHTLIREILSYNKKHHGWNHDPVKNPFSGLVKCGKCDRSISFETSNQGKHIYRYYRCTNTLCEEKKRIRFEVLELAVINEITKIATAIANEVTKRDTTIYRPQELTDLENQLIMLDSIPGFSQPIEDAKQKIKSEISILASKIEIKQESIDLSGMIDKFSEMEFWTQLKTEDKPSFYHGVVSSVSISDGEVRSVELRFS